MTNSVSLNTPSTPLLSLLFNITNIPTLRSQFMLNEEQFFDAFSIDDTIREIFRNGADTALLTTKITDELEQFALPGKVMPYNPDNTNISVLSLLFNLAIGTIKKDKFSADKAITAFNVTAEKDIANIHTAMDDKASKIDRENALDALGQTMMAELKLFL